MLNSPILATYFCMAWSLAVDFSFIMLGAASCCFLARIYLASWLNWILNFNQIDIKKSKEFTPVRLWSISRLIFYNSLKLLGLEYDWPFIARRNNLFFWECRSKHSIICPIPLFWQLAPISRTLLPEDRSSLLKTLFVELLAIYRHLAQPWTKRVFGLMGRFFRFGSIRSGLIKLVIIK